MARSRCNCNGTVLGGLLRLVCYCGGGTIVAAILFQLTIVVDDVLRFLRQWNLLRTPGQPQKIRTLHWLRTSAPSLVVRRPRKREGFARSTLSQLPPELRAQIWEYCIGHRFVYQPIAKPLDWYGPRPTPKCLSTQIKGSLTGWAGWYPLRTTYLNSWPIDIHIRPAADDSGHTRPGVRTIAYSAAVRRVSLLEHEWPRDVPPARGHHNMTHLRFIGAPPPAGSKAKLYHWTGWMLLLACRQIYIEAAPVLYASNTFSFSCPFSFAFFRAHVGSQHLSHLRYLHLGLSVGQRINGSNPVDYTQWQAICKVLTDEMLTLNELDLELHLPLPSEVAGRYVSREDLGQYASFYEDVASWVLELAPLRGRLRRARFMCNPECFYERNRRNDEQLGAFRENRLNEGEWGEVILTILRLGRRMKNMELFVTSSTNGIEVTGPVEIDTRFVDE